jgi:hypothetical protein
MDKGENDAKDDPVQEHSRPSSVVTYKWKDDSGGDPAQDYSPPAEDGDDDNPPPDEDNDNDGILDIDDNCHLDYNPTQEDNDNDGIGDVCDDDDDDGVLDIDDNCHLDYNPAQEDNDNDGIGDVCDDNDDDEAVVAVSREIIIDEGFITVTLYVLADSSTTRTLEIREVIPEGWKLYGSSPWPNNFLGQNDKVMQWWFGGPNVDNMTIEYIITGSGKITFEGEYFYFNLDENEFHGLTGGVGGT